MSDGGRRTTRYSMYAVARDKAYLYIIYVERESGVGPDPELEKRSQTASSNNKVRIKGERGDEERGGLER